MKVRHTGLRKQSCNPPEIRIPHGRTPRLFTANGALPLQAISPHTSSALAGSHACFSHDSHRAGRSRRTDAGGGRGAGTTDAIASWTRIGFAAPCPVWTLLVATRARRSWAVLQVSSACAPDYFGALPRNASACFRGADCVRGDRHSRRHARRIPPRACDGPRRGCLHSLWTGFPEFRPGTRVDSSFFD